MKNRPQLIIAFLCLLFIGVHGQAQEISSENKLTKKELRAKRKKAREIEKLNKLYAIRMKGKELLESKDFVLKSDGRTGWGTTNFLKISGDTLTIQLWHQGQTGNGVPEADRGGRKITGQITRYKVLDHGDGKAIQAEIDFVEKFTFQQLRAFVYIIGNRAEGGIIGGTSAESSVTSFADISDLSSGLVIRGRFSNVADSNIYEMRMNSPNLRGRRVTVARKLGGI